MIGSSWKAAMYAGIVAVVLAACTDANPPVIDADGREDFGVDDVAVDPVDGTEEVADRGDVDADAPPIDDALRLRGAVMSSAGVAQGERFYIRGALSSPPGAARLSGDRFTVFVGPASRGGNQ